MNKAKNFEDNVLLELLELSISQEKLIKKHILEGGVFEIEYYGNWYRKETKNFSVVYDAYGINNRQFAALKTQFGLKDTTDLEKDYYPENLKISFEDLPSLSVIYTPTSIKTEFRESYNFKPYWFQKTKSIEVVKTVREYTHLYTITHGKISTTISREKFDSLLSTLKNNLSSTEKKIHLEKAISRIREFKGTKNKS